MTMEADWDLHAVVRACISPSAATPSSSKIITESKSEFTAPSSCLPFGDLVVSEDSCNAGISNSIGDLQELFRPFLKNAPTCNLSNYPAAIPKEQPPFKHSHKQPLGSSAAKMSNTHTPRSKRRKNQMKKVCHVPAEALSFDVWAWRKYGQKPIKGSPYPRGYYRCSSSKGCLARKQVERNRSDPKMFIVTYTAEHNHPAPTHRNSLAGSTRQKMLTPNAGADSDKGTPKASCTSPASSQEDDAQHSNNSGSPEDKEEDDIEDEDNFRMISEDTMSDDFFAGLEEFTAASSADVITESLDLPQFADRGSSPTPQF